MLASLESARLISGGQSLVPMLNMRYVFFDHLIDINRVEGLSGFEFGRDTVRIGTMTRQRDILESVELKKRAPVVAEALSYVGHLHTRNRGTIGGSLAHMDPAAELFCIATLLEAIVHVESAAGARNIPIAEYPLSYMTPQLNPDEMIVGVTLKLPAAGHGWGFQEFAQRHGDFAIVSVAATIELSSSGAVSHVRAVLAGVDFAPQRLLELEEMLINRVPDEALICSVSEAASRVDAMSDAMFSGTYRQRLAKVLTRRVLVQAIERAKNGALQ